jgi:hydrogenase expression/formation protein HypD
MYFREKHSGLKFISEYRDSEAIRQLLWEISATCTGEWKIMEVCGGQTHSLAKNGLLQLLPHSITMVHGPGCPVCVTPASMIDKAIDLAMNHSVTLCTYGDMMRVPGTGSSLLQAKALGADVRITYSPLDALKLAEEFPQREVVFFAVGFETTAPANALAVVEAERKGVYNFSILTA